MEEEAIGTFIDAGMRILTLSGIDGPLDDSPAATSLYEALEPKTLGSEEETTFHGLRLLWAHDRLSGIDSNVLRDGWQWGREDVEWKADSEEDSESKGDDEDDEDEESEEDEDSEEDEGSDSSSEEDEDDEGDDMKAIARALRDQYLPKARVDVAPRPQTRAVAGTPGRATNAAPAPRRSSNVIATPRRTTSNPTTPAATRGSNVATPTQGDIRDAREARELAAIDPSLTEEQRMLEIRRIRHNASSRRSVARRKARRNRGPDVDSDSE